MFIPDPDAEFLPIPDPGVKKAPDPGSGSQIRIRNIGEKGGGINLVPVCCVGWSVAVLRILPILYPYPGKDDSSAKIWLPVFLKENFHIYMRKL